MNDFNIIDHLDEEQTLQLAKLYQNEWWTKGRKEPDIKEMLRLSSLIIGLCHAKSRELIGFARVLTDFTYKAFVYDIIVKESYRKTGLGLKLLDIIATHPRLAKVEHIDLNCKPEMIPFYEKGNYFVPDHIRLMRLKPR